MVPTEHLWRSPTLSTSSEAAVRAYRRGIAALVAGAPHAEQALQDAVAADPEFALAHLGLAAARFAAGEPFTPGQAAAGPTTPAERHHVEIVEAACSGDRDRAAALRREHLLELPGDLLVVWAPILHRGDASVT